MEWRPKTEKLRRGLRAKASIALELATPDDDPEKLANIRDFERLLEEIFSMASAMCGSHHPDDIDDERRQIEATYQYLLRALLRDWRP